MRALQARLDAEFQSAAATEPDSKLPARRREKFEKMASLVLEPKSKTPSGTAHRRNIARKVLREVGSRLGAEMFFLCTQVFTVHALATGDMDAELSSWWSQQQHNPNLVIRAQSLWTARGLDRLNQHLEILSHEPENSSDEPMQFMNKHFQTVFGQEGTGRAYHPFSCMPRDSSKAIPEPLRAGMCQSKLWEQEERNQSAITQCLSIYIPESATQDSLLVVRLGYAQSWNMLEQYGFGAALALYHPE
ncbi:hypothetical protein DOTSEDRAFT_57345 [Dothistroma septosporum NZE10]|uniref:Uncharacterized protein n=1 Tax=Dothistroma septosporum (strain NZE10 / CBS 128990) TaxID=675120 RepID=M2WJD5_DOTSN|nr:hypothetical protein DOTSEDRAFT_57345 [Dothistroma septosporum NZE10]